jgi:hypothetical protein
MSTFYTPDGAAVNTAPESGLTQASANISGACSASSVGNYILLPTVAVPGSGAVAPTATRNVLPDSQPTGTTFWVPRGVKTHLSTQANFSSIGSVNAFVLRTVQVAAAVITTASLAAIPADQLGESDSSAVATVSPTATRVQLSTANSSASGSATATADVNRQVVANISSQNTVYVTVGINGVFEAYAPMPCSATVAVDPVGLRTAPALSTILATATGSATGTLVQPGLGEPLGVSSTLILDPFLSITPGVAITASGTVQTSSFITTPISSSISASVVTTGRGSQTFQAATDLQPNLSTIVANISNNFFSTSVIQGNTNNTATGVIFKVSEANVSAQAGVVNDDTVTQQLTCTLSAPNAVVTAEARLAERGESNISAPSGTVLVEARLAEQGQVAVSPAGDCVVFDDQLLITRFVEAQLTPAATVSSAGVIIKVASASISTPNATVTSEARLAERGEADISGAGAVANVPGVLTKLPNVEISSTGQVVLGDYNFVFIVQFAESSVSGSGTVLADSIANIDSLDPDQRTFIRPPMTTNFVRPFQQFTFRRPS